MRYRLIGLLLLGAAALILFVAFSRPLQLKLLRSRAGQVRTQAREHAVIKDGHFLKGCPGEDLGDQLQFTPSDMPLLSQFGVTNFSSRSSEMTWQRFNGDYPESWPRWLALPRNAYLLERESVLPELAHYEPCVTSMLVKADARKLIDALTAQVPQGIEVTAYTAMPVVVANKGPGTREDRYGFNRRDAGRIVRFKLRYGAALQGWVLLSIDQRRIMEQTPIQP